MIIYTGKHEDCISKESVSISKLYGDKRLCFLAPRDEWFQREESIANTKDVLVYTSNYYERYLKHLCPSYVLSKLKDGMIITSREDAHDFSHRLIVAIWLELYYGFKVREVKIDTREQIITCGINKYYTQIKEFLSDLIKTHREMFGYTSIAASYAYEQAQKVAKINPIKEEFGDLETMYLRLADVLENKLNPKGHIIKPVNR